MNTPYRWDTRLEENWKTVSRELMLWSWHDVLCCYLTRVRGDIVSLQESVTRESHPPPSRPAPPGLHTEGRGPKHGVPPGDLHVGLQALLAQLGQSDVGGAGAGNHRVRQLHRDSSQGNGRLVIQHLGCGVQQELGDCTVELTYFF